MENIFFTEYRTFLCKVSVILNNIYLSLMPYHYYLGLKNRCIKNFYL